MKQFTKYLVVLMLLITSCSAERRCASALDKAKRLGCLKDSVMIVHDTTKEVRDTGSVKLVLDSALMDSLLNADTCFTKARIETVIRNAKVKPVNIDDSLYSLKIWMDKGVLKHDLVIKPRYIQVKTKGYVVVNPPQKCELPDWVKMVIAGLGVLCLGLGAILILKR